MTETTNRAGLVSIQGDYWLVHITVSYVGFIVWAPAWNPPSAAIWNASHNRPIQYYDDTPAREIGWQLIKFARHVLSLNPIEDLLVDNL